MCVYSRPCNAGVILATSPLAALSIEIDAGIRRLIGSVSSSQQLLLAELHQRASEASSAADKATWDQAIDDWRQSLDGLAAALPAPFPNGSALISRLVAEQLPPVPGIAGILAFLAAQQDSLSRELSIGPASVRVDVPAVKVRFPGDDGAIVSEEMVGFRLPTTIGFSLDAGPARGGGQLTFESQPNRRFLGALGVNLGVVEVSAYALLDVLPQDRYSVAVLLTARFIPGIQLSFGFAITAIGGLVGIDREIHVEELQARFQSGAVVDAIFANDPAANAPAILETLSAILRPKPGRFVVGPTIQISWLQIGSSSFFTFGIAVLMELPGPVRALIVGTARAEIAGPGVPLLYLRADALGLLDTERSLVAIDAALVNSRILEIFRLTGNAAFRLHWGPRGYAIVTIGGFYPGFNPEPASFPPLQRVGLSLDLPVPGIYLRAEAYVAVTPNTCQLGGSLEAGLKVGPFSAGGHLNIDAIFQYEPFEFDARFTAGFAVKYKGHSFAGVHATGHVSGPGPVVVRAEFKVRVIVSIPFDHTFTLGRTDDRPPKIVPDLFAYLRPELARPANLRAEGGDDRYVALRPDRVTVVNGKAVLANHGKLVWEQKRVPLNHTVERVENIPLALPAGARVKAVGKIATQAEEKDFFSPATFLTLRTDAERLNQPQFDHLPSGVVVTFQQDQAPAIDRVDEFLEVYRPPLQEKHWRVRLPLSAALMGAVAALHQPPDITNTDPKFTVVDEPWGVQPGAAPAPSQTAAHYSARGQSGRAALPLADRVDLGVVA